MPDSDKTFAVIIPYYQREAGILRRALRSVFSAERIDLSSIHIYIIDDEAPVSARSEVQALGQAPCTLTIVEQPNAGPGAARNAGLARVETGTKYVAFLDSDDEWEKDHLANAAFALDAGYDCYFANFFHLGQKVGAFERAGRIRSEDHPLIAGSTTIRAFNGDMFDQVIAGNIIGTSTVAFNFEKFADLRFRTDLRSAGEDYLFWLSLATRGARFAFCAEIEVTYGAGLNIYSGSGWGTEGHLLRIQNEIRYRKLIAASYPLAPAQTRHLDHAIAGLRTEFIRALVHRGASLRPVPLGVVAAQIRNDPALLLAIFPIVSRILLRRS